MVFFFQVDLMILKLKAIRDTIDKEGIHLPDDLGLVNVGSNVRSAALDELLQ
jgi:lipopolysaccharide/colanic/teichoic acid biosynthesis glycosyltransferase